MTGRNRAIPVRSCPKRTYGSREAEKVVRVLTKNRGVGVEPQRTPRTQRTALIRVTTNGNGPFRAATARERGRIERHTTEPHAKPQGRHERLQLGKSKRQQRLTQGLPAGGWPQRRQERPGGTVIPKGDHVPAGGSSLVACHLQPAVGRRRVAWSALGSRLVARDSWSLSINALSFDVEHLPLAQAARDYDGNASWQAVQERKDVAEITVCHQWPQDKGSRGLSDRSSVHGGGRKPLVLGRF